MKPIAYTVVSVRAVSEAREGKVSLRSLVTGLDPLHSADPSAKCSTTSLQITWSYAGKTRGVRQLRQDPSICSHTEIDEERLSVWGRITTTVRGRSDKFMVEADVTWLHVDFSIAVIGRRFLREIEFAIDQRRVQKYLDQESA